MPASSVRYPPGYPPRDGFRRAGIVAWSVLGVLLLTGVIVWLLALLRDIFPPVAMALILIFLLNPMVSALERKGVRRWFGTAAIYFLFIAVVVTAVSLLAPPLGRQVNGLIGRFPEIRDEALDVGENLASKVGLSLSDFGITSGGPPQPAPSDSGAATEPEAPGPGAGSDSGSSFIQDLGARLFAGAGRFATSAIHLVVNFILAPILALYLLIDLPKIERAFLHYTPPRYRKEWLPLLDRALRAVGAFFRGQLLVAAIVGVLSSIAFLLIDLPFWLPLGLLVGFFNIIPLIGPFVGGAIAAVVGGVTGGLGLALKAAAAMVVVQQFDNHFISPKVMGRAVRLHPVAVILALVAGAGLGGIWGMLLAVPGLGVAKIVLVHFYETRVLGNLEYLPTIAGGGLAAKAADMEHELNDLQEEAEARDSKYEPKLHQPASGAELVPETVPTRVRDDRSKENEGASAGAGPDGVGETAKAPPDGDSAQDRAQSVPDGFVQSPEEKPSPSGNV